MKRPSVLRGFLIKFDDRLLAHRIVGHYQSWATRLAGDAGELNKEAEFRMWAHERPPHGIGSPKGIAALKWVLRRNPRRTPEAANEKN